MKNRDVQPELLDSMPGDDPRARRSRRDLAMINRLMGNFRWARQAVGWALDGRDLRVWELGSGDGWLLEQLVEDGVAVTGVDLLPRPEGLAKHVKWREGDVMEVLGEGVDGVVVANLFLHHFKDDRLAEMGHMLGRCEVICVSEPWRSRLALLEGRFLYPFVNGVTRHDMMVSIRAGFRRGELPRLLGLGEGWEVREQCTRLGACRMLAWKK
jgi:hypothetical protein